VETRGRGGVARSWWPSAAAVGVGIGSCGGQRHEENRRVGLKSAARWTRLACSASLLPSVRPHVNRKIQRLPSTASPCGFSYRRKITNTRYCFRPLRAEY
jgi:hypothetical protein